MARTHAENCKIHSFSWGHWQSLCTLWCRYCLIMCVFRVIYSTTERENNHTEVRK
nr:MAG TPA: hypothetical protein [Caudoviricetes sp.]